ncbi:hypothetical protein PLICRDRAFT_104992 [Plicaturopsis crispa FD-325 SS-3]|nr:hypothetical protein PLICRDRAFT_104992 [Plicaturopsis crispa FD-325 SS-3]
MPGKYCQRALTPSGCNVKDCRKNHDIRQCPCGVVVPLKYSWEGHVRSRKHLERVGVLSRNALDDSFAVPPAANVSAPQSGAASGRAPGADGLIHCAPCDLQITPTQWPFHNRSRHHQQRQRQYDAQDALASAELDKHGITVSHPKGVDFGILEAEEAVGSSDPQSMAVTIKTNLVGRRVKLESIRVTSSPRQDSHGKSFSATLLGESKKVESARARAVVVVFHPAYEGRYDDTLELLFKDTQRRIQFAITRKLCATVGSREDHAQLQPSAPYVRRQYVPLERILRIIPAERPPTWSQTKWVKKLLEFKAPEDLIATAFPPGLANIRAARAAVMQRYIPASLNQSNYTSRFQHLLWIEEEQCRRDLDQFSMTDVELKAKHPRYDLQVEGLGEGRPSVIVGDTILVKQQGTSTDWFAGCVHMVYANHVSLRFASNFSTFRGTKFDIRFHLNRLPLRRMHCALKYPFMLQRLLFPGREHIANIRAPTQDQLNEINPVNRLLSGDRKQLETVGAILHQPEGSVPFVVFGPPGTGKTVTIVEAIHQLLINKPHARILACAPSNSAADQIAKKLSTLGPNVLFRLNSMSRKHGDLPKSLREFSLINDNEVFAIPSRQVLEKYRVVVSTCVAGGVMDGLGMKRGHFTHIFIDEAGQAMEPEIMVPVKTMANNATNIILAGDNKQLGPIVRSSMANSLGLKESYLSRIMALPIYDLGPDSNRGTTIVKLVQQWRSHPAIMAFSNDNFYDGELEPCGDPVVTHSLLRSSVLATPGFPVVFHGIVGRDSREASSPSFFNIDEVTQVKKYCLDLFSDRKLRIRPEDIGIITPYHAQCHKILNALPSSLRDVKVGSVEEFQGQERRVIILSTVRSNTDFIRHDIRHTLGFVANARRFNVAITRAQAMLIVIGNPNVLSLDPLWRSFMNTIHSQGGWRGKEIDWDPEEPVRAEGGYDAEVRQRAEGDTEDMIRRLKSYIVENSESWAAADGESYSEDGIDGEGFADQPWREYE